jgi:hypothetical protein
VLGCRIGEHHQHSTVRHDVNSQWHKGAPLSLSGSIVVSTSSALYIQPGVTVHSMMRISGAGTLILNGGSLLGPNAMGFTVASISKSSGPSRYRCSPSPVSRLSVFIIPCDCRVLPVAVPPSGNSVSIIGGAVALPVLTVAGSLLIGAAPASLTIKSLATGSGASFTTGGGGVGILSGTISGSITSTSSTALLNITATIAGAASLSIVGGGASLIGTLFIVGSLSLFAITIPSTTQLSGAGGAASLILDNAFSWSVPAVATFATVTIGSGTVSISPTGALNVSTLLMTSPASQITSTGAPITVTGGTVQGSITFTSPAALTGPLAVAGSAAFTLNGGVKGSAWNVVGTLTLANGVTVSRMAVISGPGTTILAACHLNANAIINTTTISEYGLLQA